MEGTQGALSAQLTVIRHARDVSIMQLCALCLFSVTAVESNFWMSVVLLVSLGGLAIFVFATRKADWGTQPIRANERGLQIGSLFNDLRGAELLARTQLAGRIELHGRFLTLELCTEDAQVATLNELVNRGLGSSGPDKKLLDAKLGIILGVLVALGLGAALWALGLDPREQMRQITQAVMAVGLLAQALSSLYHKRAGQRL